jgi:ElaB/YqjD/DUF883 family membrane-anchored ribosome-binding protein
MTKEQILEEAQKQIASFQKQIEDLNLKAKVDGLSADAKKLYEDQRKDLVSMLDEAEKQFSSIGDKASESWQETKDFVELTQKALKHSFNYFMSHYK